MSACNYTWYKFKMYVGCLKCGAKIAMQSTNGNPTCQECGEINENTWEEVCNIADIKDLIKGQVSNKKITSSTVDISLKTGNADAITCHHCKTKVEFHEDLLQKRKYDCPSCNKNLDFESLPSNGDFVFYRYINQKIDTAQNSVIVVHCAACGAPLQKNPEKINYHCDFCNCENILPLALRQKRVLDDIFAAVIERTIAIDKIVESTNYQEVIACLKANKKEAFGVDVLNNLQLKFPDNLQIYHIIADDLGYEFSAATFEKLWITSTSSVFLKIIGQKLNKTEDEIAKRSKKVYKNYKKPEQASSSKKEGGTGLFGSLKKLFE